MAFIWLLLGMALGAGIMWVLVKTNIVRGSITPNTETNAAWQKTQK